MKNNLHDVVSLSVSLSFMMIVFWYYQSKAKLEFRGGLKRRWWESVRLRMFVCVCVLWPEMIIPGSLSWVPAALNSVLWCRSTVRWFQSTMSESPSRSAELLIGRPTSRLSASPWHGSPARPGRVGESKKTPLLELFTSIVAAVIVVLLLILL